jgi:hypothetical protein
VSIPVCARGPRRDAPATLGFDRCRALIHGGTGFQYLFADAMTVERVTTRDDAAAAKEVTYDLASVDSALDAEGF